MSRPECRGVPQGLVASGSPDQPEAVQPRHVDVQKQQVASPSFVQGQRLPAGGERPDAATPGEEPQEPVQSLAMKKRRLDVTFITVEPSVVSGRLDSNQRPPEPIQEAWRANCRENTALSRLAAFYAFEILQETGHFSSCSLPSKRSPESAGEQSCIVKLAPANLRKNAAHWMRRSI
jgi:hypothetical protein